MNDLETFENSTLSELLTTQNKSLEYFEDLVNKEEYNSFEEILLAHNITLKKVDEREAELEKRLLEIEEEIKCDNYCDKWDYLFAGSAGVLAGLVDSFLVGSPTDSKLLSSSDEVVNKLVERFAKLNGWDGPKGDSNPTRSAIAFLERMFKVNYDQRHSGDVSGIFSMSPGNHHLKSLAHSPSPIGLLFSIIDQFRGTSTFLDRGRLITIDADFRLQGSNFPSMLFSAFYNWLGHIMSDIAGSSGASQRGSGVAIPFYELLSGLDIGEFGEEKRSFAEIAVKVFENGYDARFGLTLAIPVLMVELFVRLFCILRHRFQFKKSWKDCLIFLKADSSPRLRKMLLVGHGTLCLIDAGDAFIKSGGPANWVMFFSRLNFVAWVRLAHLGAKHLISILRNDIAIQRYKLRAQAFDEYVEDVNQIVDDFLAAHSRKMDKFFLERRVELNNLFGRVDDAIMDGDFLLMSNQVQQIGSKYGFVSKMDSFEEVNQLIDDDEY